MTEQEYTLEKEVRLSYIWKRNTKDIPAVNIDKEWQHFCTDRMKVASRRIGWQRWSIAASMLLLCTIGLAFGWRHLINNPAIEPSKTEMSNTVIANDTILEDSTKLTFRNTTLSTILQEIAARHQAKVRFRCQEDVFLYVELEKSWNLQECVDFLNHFDRVNIKLTQDNIIVAE